MRASTPNQKHVPIASIFDVTPRFLRATNLQRDFHDQHALADYVITPHTESCMRRISAGLRPGSTQRSWRVTGNYGSGKSSFALFLAHWFGGSKQVGRVAPQLAYDRLGVARPSFTPLLITGSREPLSIAIVRSLGALLKSERVSAASLQRRIAAVLRDGRISDAEVVELIQAVNRTIIEQARRGGMLLVIDELGKFLEYAAHHSASQDVYLLQQLAECAATSAKVTPLFIVALLHQGFDAYAEHLDPLAQREWEKVAGRFEELVFEQPVAEVAHLVASALRVRTRSLPRVAANEAADGMRLALRAGLFGPRRVVDAPAAVAAQIYPLHATTLPIIVRAFRRFGQNERSLFGFLLSDEPYSLAVFAQRPIARGTTYRITDFFDYLCANFSYRLALQSYRSHWAQIASMIESFGDGDPAEVAVLKTVGVLNLLNEQDMQPTDVVIEACLGGVGGYASKDLRAAIERLQRMRVLFRRGVAGGWCLWPHTSVDLQSAYEAAERAVGPVRSVAGAVAEHVEARPVVARKHYIETGNLRYFDVLYVPICELESSTVATTSADARIVIALCETAADTKSAVTLAQEVRAGNAVLVAVPKEPLSNLAGLVAETQRWEWVIRNTPELDGDRFAREEASRQLATARAILASRIDGLIGVRSPRGAQALRWFVSGREAVIGNGRELTRALSDLCDALYPHAPRVRNELLNRNVLSSAAAAARMRLIGGILRRSNEPLLGMDASKKPPEMSMYLSLLRHSRIHREASPGVWRLYAPTKHDALRLAPSFAALQEALERRIDERVRVTDLMDILAAPPFGVRVGLAPVLLALYLAMNVQELAMYEEGTFLRDIGENEFLRLTKAPQKFDLQLCRVTGLRQDVFQSLLRVLQLKQSDGREPLVLDVVRPICSYVAQLPEYARTTRQLSDATLSVRAAILAAREPVTMLFRDLPLACGVEPFAPTGAASSRRAQEFATRLRAALDELRGGFDALLGRLAKAVHTAFGMDGEFEDLRRSLAVRARDLAAFTTDGSTRAFCVRLADERSSERAWLEALASALATQPPARWTDAHEETFVRELQRAVDRMRRVEAIAFAGGTHEHFAQAFHLTIATRDGDEAQRVILIDRSDEDVVNGLATEIEKLVHRRGAVGLAALSRAAWKSLRENER